MTHTIPLIRSAVIQPFIRWMLDHDRPVEDRLDRVDLAFVLPGQKEVPIPIVGVLALFRLMAAEEGPDIAVRVIQPQSLLDFGNFGQVILGSRSPRDALGRVVNALPRYSTHEQVSLWPSATGLSLHAGWAMALDDEDVHLTQQFTAALAWALCSAVNLPQSAPRSLRIRAHPRFGLAHLRPWFGAALGEAVDAPLEVDFDDRVLDAPLHFGAMAAPSAMPANWDVLKGDGSFSHSARLVMKSLDPAYLTVQWLAEVAGVSGRSVQRALTAENTNFRQLLDHAKMNKAIELIRNSADPLGKIAADLGYADQSVLSRAVWRWTGMSPKKLRLVERFVHPKMD